MKCPDCHNARLYWDWDGMESECYGCFVRAIAKSPKDVKGPIYKRVEAERGKEEKDLIVAQVRRELRRLSELKRAMPAARWQV